MYSSLLDLRRVVPCRDTWATFVYREREREWKGEWKGGYGFVSLLRSAAPACAVQLISNNFRALAACKTV